MDGAHAWREEERGDDCTIGVVQDVESGEKFVLGPGDRCREMLEAELGGGWSLDGRAKMM